MWNLVLSCKCILIILILGPVNASAQKPNVVFILADDLGWGDLGCYGNPYLETPHLNQLAREGILMTHYYSPSPLCAPARAGILTGRYNHRTGAVDVSSNRGIDRIERSEKTMGDYFRHAGYSTALIGKWHNGVYNPDYLPHNRGFDLFYGFPNGGQDFYDWNLMRNGAYVQNTGEYLTDALTKEAISFLEDNKSKPFFLFLSHHAPHPPLQAPMDLIQKYTERLKGIHSDETAIVYAMIEVMDQAIGRLIHKLEELDLRRNTIIVFTSDNGAFYFDKKNPRYHGPFSGQKGNVLEQGIRVPAIISWKNTIPENQVFNTPIHGCDWLPTLYSVTGKTAPEHVKPLDGINIMSVLTGDRAGKELVERSLYFQKTRYTPVRHSDAAMCMGDWKLYWPGVPSTMSKDNLRDGLSYIKGITDPHWEMPLDAEIPSHGGIQVVSPRLFNLVKDPMEMHDVAEYHPLLVTKMTKQYDNWFDDVYRDWELSWTKIKEHDKEYWEGRKLPDPNYIYEGHWPWDKIAQDSTLVSPLDVFKGFWSTN